MLSLHLKIIIKFSSAQLFSSWRQEFEDDKVEDIYMQCSISFFFLISHTFEYDAAGARLVLLVLLMAFLFIYLFW